MAPALPSASYSMAAALHSGAHLTLRSRGRATWAFFLSGGSGAPLNFTLEPAGEILFFWRSRCKARRSWLRSGLRPLAQVQTGAVDRRGHPGRRCAVSGALTGVWRSTMKGGGSGSRCSRVRDSRASNGVPATVTSAVTSQAAVLRSGGGSNHSFNGRRGYISRL